jgi:hypothetical protein
MLGIGRPDRHPLLRFTSKEIAPTADACSPPASGFVLRRNPVVAARSGEGLLTEPTTDAQPARRERLKMPEAVGKRVSDIGRRAVFYRREARDADRQTGACGLSEAIRF